MSGMPQVIITNVPQEPTPIPVNERLAKSNYQTDAWMNLRLMHQGVRSVDYDYVGNNVKTAPVWAEDEDGVLRFIDKDLRPLPFGSVDDKMDYDMQGSSSSGDTGLLAPDEIGVWKDYVDNKGSQVVEMMPGEVNGPIMNDDNYLSMPGWPVRSALIKIQNAAVNGDASDVTLNDLIVLGLTVDEAKMEAYQAAIEGAGNIANFEELKDLIDNAELPDSSSSAE